MFFGLGKDTATAIASRFVVSRISVALTVSVIAMVVPPLAWFVFFLFFIKVAYPLRVGWCSFLKLVS